MILFHSYINFTLSCGRTQKAFIAFLVHIHDQRFISLLLALMRFSWCGCKLPRKEAIFWSKKFSCSSRNFPIGFACTHTHRHVYEWFARLHPFEGGTKTRCCRDYMVCANEFVSVCALTRLPLLLTSSFRFSIFIFSARRGFFFVVGS